MLINRAFFREAAFVTIAVVVVLLALFVLQGAGGVFTRTSDSGRDNSSLLALIILYPLVNFGLLLTLAMFIGLLVTLSRWYRDSEIVVLQACGIGTMALLRPVMWFALVFFVVLGAETFFMRPMVLSTIAQIEALTKQSNSTAWITGGSFTTVEGQNSIFYAERVGAGGEMHDVFLNRPATKKESERTIVARKAERYTDTELGEEFLQFSEGTSYLGSPGEVDFQLLDFDRYRFRIRMAPLRVRHLDVQAVSSRELLSTPRPGSQAEWYLRLSKPAVVFVLATLALALSYTEPRRNRYFNLFIAIALFFAYMQALLVAETLLRRGELPVQIGLWWVHVLFGLLAGYMIWRRALGLPLVALPTHGRRA